MEGIDFLPLNALSVLYGEYVYVGTQTAVYFVRDEVFISNSWKMGKCRDYEVFSLPASARIIYYYLDTQGWSLFISVDGEIADPCLFLAEFIRRFRYFQGIAKDPRNTSFPAVLEFNN